MDDNYSFICQLLKLMSFYKEITTPECEILMGSNGSVKFVNPYEILFLQKEPNESYIQYEKRICSSIVDECKKVLDKHDSSLQKHLSLLEIEKEQFLNKRKGIQSLKQKLDELKPE